MGEKVLLKSVESLITAIKSGHLIKEQEESNQRIQEILGNILDKTNNPEIFDLFEDSRRSLGKITEASTRNLEISESDPESARNLASISNHNLSLLLDFKADSSQTSKTSRDLALSLMSESERLLSDIHSHTMSYRSEIDVYLASLSPRAKNEDVIFTQAYKVKLHERPEPTREHLVDMSHSNKKSEIVEPQLEEKYARNLHMFCMLEKERQKTMLLPDELIDVTRKYHARNKYEQVFFF